MRNFASITQFVEFLETRPGAIRRGQHNGMHEAADMIVKCAQDKIGEYQAAVGPFSAWADLAESTLEGGYDQHRRWYPGKIELGFSPPDNPLLRHGQLRGSIEKHLTENTIVVGTHDPVAHYQEFGTSDGEIPPRPFIGPAMFQECHAAAKLVMGHILAAMFGGPPPPKPRH